MKTKITSIYRYWTNDKGFASPLALCLGLVMMLASSTILVRSQEEKITSKVQNNTYRSLNAAQVGVDHYQDLINQNKIIATYSACATSWDNGICQDSGAAMSWAKASSITGIAPACPGTGASVVAAATHQHWTNVDDNDNSLGQYRLIDYRFDNNTNIGTLVVEGRVNSQVEVNTATTRLEVELPVQPGIVDTKVPLAPRFNSMDPAVWIGESSVTAIGNVTVDGNILLSSANCTQPTGEDRPTASNLHNSNTQAIIVDPRPFPNIPSIPVTINSITNAEMIEANQLPRADDVSDSNNFYHYLVTDGLTLSEHTLKIREGTKVILYVQGNITFEGNVQINEGTTNHSAYLEIYGTQTTNSINFTGTGQQKLKAFIHAPDATVNLDSSGLNVSLIGAIWVNDWNGGNGMIKITADDQYINYLTIEDLINEGVTRVVDPLIFSPTSWNNVQLN